MNMVVLSVNGEKKRNKRHIFLLFFASDLSFFSQKKHNVVTEKNDKIFTI